MNFDLTDLTQLSDLPFDEVIDVRAPAEYAEDHLPGAISLPVLSDAERATVGTIYVQESRLEARKIGAALVARNVANHIDAHFAAKPSGYRPLVYCWRGGQRSNSMATILRQIGWRVEVLDGGYRTYRRLVNAQLYDAEFPWSLRVLEGNTGCAKTELLAGMTQAGVQVVDLEGLARHRGSVFGGFAGDPQPHQKAFESALSSAFGKLDPARPVVVEGESSKIGQLLVPPKLWHAMCAAPRIEVTASLEERARYLTRAYADIVGDSARLHALIDRLKGLHGAERIAEWHLLADEGAHVALATGLMAHHYDPAYRKHRARQPEADHIVPLHDLSAEGVAAHARQLAEML
ncbi:tRNA 2-selenouridine(34) synthase MnmH [Pontivivens insulae]|uniref:tRNA 2-selenouridine synthase n=1 Tax=Pontivivens insulae TaxID=1639689 RepID=A0A2R8AD38_9RHOB|nr:tRNA 2-selenouridine(34) synthase MnmH [Pontivivens insulae]RED14083.1 tRNA 2-selenouridine synthase [Pontivivens insulae]SPF30157.1 tRNA 2-selenouridine synthase [Pontivivens insulae]